MSDELKGNATAPCPIRRGPSSATLRRCPAPLDGQKLSHADGPMFVQATPQDHAALSMFLDCMQAAGYPRLRSQTGSAQA